MTKAYVKNISFGLLLLALLNGVWSQLLDCQMETNKCLIQAVGKGGISPEELADPKGSGVSGIMTKIGELDLCQFMKDFRECEDKIDSSQCDIPVEPYLKTTLNSLKGAETQFKCDKPEVAKCLKFIFKCAANAFVESGTTAEDMGKIRRPINRVPNIEEIVTGLGKEKGCNYLKSYGMCIVRDRCAAIPTVGIEAVAADIKYLYDQEKCGCASTTASLALMLIASIFVLFYRK